MSNSINFKSSFPIDFSKDFNWSELLQLSEDYFFIIDTQFNFKYVNRINPVVAEKTGYNLETIIGHSFFDFIPDSSKNPIKHKFKRAIDTHQTQILEVIGAFSEQAYETHISPVIENNKVVLFFLITRDISERNNSKIALKQSEKKYRQIVELALEGIWTLDSENKTNFANQKMAEMLEYTPQDMLGKKVDDFMDQEGKEHYIRKFSFQKQTKSEKFEFRLITRLNKEIWVTMNTTPLFKNKVYQGALAMVTDITHERQNKARLNELNAYLEQLAEERSHYLRTILSNTPMILFEINAKGFITMSEGSGLERIGLKPGEIVGQNVFEL